MVNVLRFLAVTAGVAAGAVIIKKLIDNYEVTPPKQKSAFEKLVNTQLVCDTLEGSVAADWFRNQQENTDRKLVFFIAKPTAETVKMFDLDHIPEQLDCSHSLLQAAVDAESYEVAAIRLISYNTMNKSLAELLNGKDYIIVEGE